jgi:hypothetical protein
VQHFYESCKTLEYIEADREKPLMKIINNLGGWDVLRSFNLYNWDPHRVLRHREYILNRRQWKISLKDTFQWFYLVQFTAVPYCIPYLLYVLNYLQLKVYK